MTPIREFDFESLRGKRILVVDDMKDNQVLGQMFLRKVGAFVEVASNGLEAIEKVIQQEFDAILMDLHMPILDGLAATERLRSRGFQKPIIVVTADCRVGVKERAFETGVNGYLSKPLSWRELLEALEKFCTMSSNTVGQELH